jgi:hypothetical protein
MLVCKVGTDLEACEEAQRGDYVIVKLNFDHSELTPGRLIVIQDGENFTALKYDPAEVDCSEVTAVVMRVDRVVWEHGARSEDEILDAGLIG